MIIVHVQVKIQPHQREAFVQRVLQDSAVSRAQSGCISFNWTVDLEDDSKFGLYEVWETAEAFDTYKASDHFQRINDVLPPMLVEPPTSRYYSASVYA